MNYTDNLDNEYNDYNRQQIDKINKIKQYNKQQSSVTPPSKIPVVGQVFKSYKDMCNYLQLQQVGGRSKKYQLERLKCFFNWERKGNSYVITEVYNESKPLPKIRGRGNMTVDDLLYYIVFLYILKFSPRDENNPDCIVMSKSQLKQGWFKMINNDYYNVRNKDSKKELIKWGGFSKQGLETADSKVTGKTNQTLNRVLNKLIKRSMLYVSASLYIYYENLDEEGNRSGFINCRAANDEEINIILLAGFKSRQELEDEYEKEYERWLEKEYIGLTEEERDDVVNGKQGPHQKYGMELEEYLKRKQLEYLNSVQGYARERGEKWINIVDKIQLFVPKEEDGCHPIDEEIERNKKEYNKLLDIAIKCGDVDQNVINEYRGYVESLPGIQTNINQGMLEWFNGAGKRGEIEQVGLKDQDIQKNAGGWKLSDKERAEFGGRFINVLGQEREFDIEEYVECPPPNIEGSEGLGGSEGSGDSEGSEGMGSAGCAKNTVRDRVWKLRYSSSIVEFTNTNLRGYFFSKIKGVKKEDEFVLWGVPRAGMVCSNCGDLIDMARREGRVRGWLPIKGYLGGAWLMSGDESGQRASEQKERECFILCMNRGGYSELKEM